MANLKPAVFPLRRRTVLPPTRMRTPADERRTRSRSRWPQVDLAVAGVVSGAGVAVAAGVPGAGDGLGDAAGAGSAANASGTRPFTNARIEPSATRA